MTTKLLRSLKKDEQSPVETTIEGNLPDWLSGTLFRNGPGRFEFGDKAYRHLFDGPSCIHKYKIENGKVFYSNRFLQTKAYLQACEGDRLPPMFGTPDLCSTAFERFKSLYSPTTQPKDNTNVNVVPHGNDRLYALTEYNRVCELNPITLDIVNTINVTKHIPSANTTFAHPHVEPDGSWITAGMNKKNSSYEIIHHGRGGVATGGTGDLCEDARVIASIPSSHSSSMGALSYFHSLGVTTNYVIFLEQAVIIDFKRFLVGVITNIATVDATYVDQTFRTRVHVVDKKTGALLSEGRFTTEPTFAFHHINAYEDESAGHIVVDICGYDLTLFDLKKLTYNDVYTERLSNETTRCLARRITVPLSELKKPAGTSKDEVHCPISVLNSSVSFELPQINFARIAGQSYKYAYGVNLFQAPANVSKLSLEEKDANGECLAVCKNYATEADGNRLMPGEPVFVPRPGATEEDDGVLLVMVLADKNDYLSVLDARDLKEIARAIVPAEARGAMTFHGFFADTQNFAKLN